MEGLAVRSGPEVGLPLRFMGAGVVSYLLLQAALAARAGQIFAGPLLQPVTLAAVHLATLGWASMVMMGAYYQLVPVLLQAELHSQRVGRASFLLYAPGVALLVVGFWTWTVGAVIAGGTLAVAGIAAFLANLALTLRRVRRWSLQGRAMAAALAFLALTVALGLTLALNLRLGFLHRSALRHLAAHFLGGLFGWFSLSIVAVGYRLIPMFILAHGYPQGWQAAVATLVGGGAALVAGAAAAGAGGPSLLAAGLPLAAGLLLFAADVARIVRHRRRRRLELVTRFTLAAVGALTAGSLLAGALLASPAPSRRATAAVAYLLLLGWVSLTIVGQLYKIVPFLSWLGRYGPRAGREPVPLVSELYDRAAGEWSFRLLILGTFGVPAALLAGWQGAARVAQAAVLAGAALFTWTMLQALAGLRPGARRRSAEGRRAPPRDGR